MFNTYDLFSMKGKNVLITGGRVMYGLGATMALADAGANLYLASHSVESAREFVEQLSTEKGIKVTAVPFDQGDPASIEAMFQTVIADGGSLDAFIHCSRTIPSSTKNGPTPWDTGDDAIEANVRTNSVATIWAWTGALRKRGELDGNTELMAFADRLEKATIDTIESGIMTGDLVSLSTLENKQKVNSEEFLRAIASRM